MFVFNGLETFLFSHQLQHNISDSTYADFALFGCWEWLVVRAQHYRVRLPFWMVAGLRSATEADLHGGPSNLGETAPFVPEESRQ